MLLDTVVPPVISLRQILLRKGKLLQGTHRVFGMLIRF